MRLKSLHIKGFKSFANDTVLNFSENVIGVVGPNGSGKSNIVDAIRWVLGEQKSKELRLESMSDVIFNGTKSRKEAATASVSLTFENDKHILPTEYQTVTITRTLYRASGESEYRLNNVVCRLKDINSLFLDTGIGSNSYAIIALGMVDDILADKENSRRRMFEQAAGVSKYKIRKRETLIKLKSATDDLNRIDDLMFEIEGNLKTLEKQAKRTQKYFDLKTEYKNVSLRHAALSIRSLREKYKGLAEKLAHEQDLYRTNDGLLYKLEANLEKEKKINTDKENALSGHQKRLNELVYQIRTKEGEKSLLTQKLGFKKTNREQLATSIGGHETELSKVADDLGVLLQVIRRESAKLEDLRAVLENSSKVYESVRSVFQDAKMSFDLRQKEKQEIERQVFELEKSAAIWKNSIENIEKESDRLNEMLRSRESENKQLNQKFTEIDSELGAREADLQKLQSSETRRLADILELEKKRDLLQEDLNKTNRNLDSKQNEYDLLRSMVENYEGFPESIKYLHEHWKKETPILTDILDVAEAFKAPIEMFLDQYLNHFIVDNVREALQGISLLRDSQKGKANFLILDRIGKLSTAPKPNVPGLIPARDVVRYDEKYEPLMRRLLGHVFIYEGNIEDTPPADEGITIISANGTLLQHGFTISGGSVGLFEGKKIGRKQQLEKLARFLEESHKEKEQFSARLDEARKDLALLKNSDQTQLINTVTRQIKTVSEEKIKLQHMIQSFAQFREETDTKALAGKKQILELRGKMDDAAAKSATLRARVAELEKPQDGSTTDMDKLSERMSAAGEKYNADNISFIRHQNLLENFSKDQEFKQVKISELTARIENEKHRLLSEERERIDIEDQLIKLDQELQSLYSEKAGFQSTLSEAEQDFFKARNHIMELEDQIRQLTKTQSQLQHSIQTMKDQFTEQKFQMQAVEERLRIEFGASLKDQPELSTDENDNLDELTSEVEKIRARMQAYGDINPLAVEAYNEMKLRYDNINVQRKDILDARESLMETMQEIETTATSQFMEAFNLIRTNFIDVFRSLFTEDDTCDLVLIDPTNPLESEIEIVAKPKGKKPKSLSQLSGGEKTLTATALLFALYLLKPAPFCIFDEVDAPLDDANIQKFNRIIQKFSSESQFIIVTHNKSTMAEVNVLYGIYMSEPGVSSVSPVDFRSLNHQPVLEDLN